MRDTLKHLEIKVTEPFLNDIMLFLDIGNQLLISMECYWLNILDFYNKISKDIVILLRFYHN